MHKTITTLLLVVLCLLFAVKAQQQEEATTPNFEKLITLQNLIDNKICTTGNFTLSCQIAFDKTIDGHHIKFDGSFSVAIDLAQRSATIVIVINGKTVLTKTVKLEDLTIPICVPVLSQFKINLCLDFANIRFSVDNKCFSATASVTLKLWMLKTITIIPPVPFGWNQAKCNALRLDAGKPL